MKSSFVLLSGEVLKRYPSVRKDVKLAIEVLLENPNL